MSDTMTPVTTDNPLVKNLVEELNKALAQIASLDETLDADGASKTKVLNAAANGVEEIATDASRQITELLDEQHGADRVGLIVALRRFLKNYDEEVSSYVEANVVEVQKPSDEELGKMREERSNVVKMAQAMFDLVKNLDADTAAKFTRPSQLRGPSGARGPLGPRLVGKFEFTVDGEVVGSKFSDVQKKVGAASVAEVRSAVESSNPGFNYAEPPVTFKFVVNDKHVVASSANESDTGDADEDDSAEGPNSDIFGDDDI